MNVHNREVNTSIDFSGATVCKTLVESRAREKKSEATLCDSSLSLDDFGCTTARGVARVAFLTTEPVAGTALLDV